MLVEGTLFGSHPVLTLQQDELRVEVYLPDWEEGFSRANRFDPSSMLRAVEYKGHGFFGSVLNAPDPESVQNASGIAEEFGIAFPPGYLEAAPGDTFLKPGIGVLRKVADTPYRFYDKHPVVARPDWEVIRSDSYSITFVQELPPTDGWGYRYERRLRLLPDEPVLVVERTLSNTGTKPIHTRHYSHNFFNVDGQAIGPGCHLELAAVLPDPPFSGKDAHPLLKWKGPRLEVVKPMEKNAYWRGDLLLPPELNRFRLVDGASRAALEMRHGFPATALCLYITRDAFSVEPFFQISVDPGEEVSWRSEYRFGTE